MDEYTPDAWFDIIGDLPLEIARQAVIRICRRQPWVSPAEIRQEAEQLRDEMRPPRPALYVVPDEDPRSPDEIEASYRRGAAMARELLGRRGRDAS